MDNQPTVTTGYAPVQSGRLYYQVAGERHPLVLLHVGIADHRMWDNQFALFARHYRTIRYDQRGFGLTESEPTTFSHRQDLLDLLDHLGVKQAHVLGLSMGGNLAIDFALEHPERVTALIPVAPGVSGFEDESRTGAQAQFEQERFTEMEALWEKKDYDRLLEMELEMWVDGPLQSSDRVSPAVRQRVHDMNELAYSHVDVKIEPTPLNPPAVNRLGEIHVPTLVIWGDLDTTGILDRCKWLVDHIPGTRPLVVPGTAHMVNMEKPDEFNRAVLDFLGQAL